MLGLMGFSGSLPLYVIMPPPVGKGAVCFAFVRPSVCLSVAYIVNNSITKSARKTKIGREIAQHTCDRHTSFKVKRSKFKVTRPI